MYSSVRVEGKFFKFWGLKEGHSFSQWLNQVGGAGSADFYGVCFGKSGSEVFSGFWCLKEGHLHSWWLNQVGGEDLSLG